MTRPELDRDLDRLGLALRAAAVKDLGREEQLARRRRRQRPRILAGGTLGLAGFGVALTLALSGATSSPAFAVTRLHGGFVQVKINRASGVAGANRRLAAMGIHEVLKPDATGRELRIACVTTPVEPDPYGKPKVYVPRPGQKRLHTTLRPRGEASSNTGAGNSGAGNTGLGNTGAGNSGLGNSGAGTAGSTGIGNTGPAAGNSGFGDSDNTGAGYQTVPCSARGTSGNS